MRTAPDVTESQAAPDEDPKRTAEDLLKEVDEGLDWLDRIGGYFEPAEPVAPDLPARRISGGRGYRGTAHDRTFKIAPKGYVVR